MYIAIVRRLFWHFPIQAGVVCDELMLPGGKIFRKSSTKAKHLNLMQRLRGKINTVDR